MLRGFGTLLLDAKSTLLRYVARTLARKYPRMVRRAVPIRPHVAAAAARVSAYGLWPLEGPWVAAACLRDAQRFAVCLAPPAFGGRRLRQQAAVSAEHITYARLEGVDASGPWFQVVATVM